MPQPTKIPRAFASSGDKNTIPDSTGSIGLASWSEGFPAITSTPFAQGGVAPKRADFNGIFNALSTVTLWYQQGGVFVYDNATNYEIGNLVIYSGEIYVCKTANGPASALHSPANDTAETYWGRIYPQNGTFDRIFFSQSSGSYTAPRTGAYRITLKSGGGGGGGQSANDKNYCGGGGGEGGTLIFYITLIKNVAYDYIIGAGGSAGDNGVVGGNGGLSQFIYSASQNFRINGGFGGQAGDENYPCGGRGGFTYSAPASSEVYVIPGSRGGTGGYMSTQWPLAQGGGSGGGLTGGTPLPGVNGGGGGGGGNNRGATAGGDGYILIEYAG